MSRPNIIKNQPKEKSLIDIESKIRNIFKQTSNPSKSSEKPLLIRNQPSEKPLFGIDTDSEGKKWIWRDSVTDEATLSKHDRLMGDTRKASFQFGKVTP